MQSCHPTSRPRSFSLSRRTLGIGAAVVSSCLLLSAAAPAHAQRLPGWLKKTTDVLNKAETVRQIAFAEEVVRESAGQAYAQMVQEKGAVETPACVAHVQTRLEAALGRPLKLKVLNDHSFNASAYPNGDMFINIGAVEQLGGDESAIAAILGHEIAHVEKKHSASRLRSEAIKNLGLLVIFKERDRLAIGTFMTGVLMKYSRDQEHEADRIGFVHAVQAGYDPEAAARCMESLASLSERRPSDFEGLFGSHPPSGERAERLHEYANAYAAGVGLKQIEDRKIPKDKLIKEITTPVVIASSEAMEVRLNRRADAFKRDRYPRFAIQTRKAGFLSVLCRTPDGEIRPLLSGMTAGTMGSDTMSAGGESLVRLAALEYQIQKDTPALLPWEKTGDYEVLFVLTTQPLDATRLAGQRVAARDGLKEAVETGARETGAAVVDLQQATLTVQR